MQATPLPVLTFPSGDEIPVLGQGTWGMAEFPDLRTTEITALRTGIDLGMTVIDTAEMYADGGAERLVGEAISGRRDEVFLVTKVMPIHGTHTATVDACERSLRRLDTDWIDLYLLHWPGTIPLDETVDAFTTLMTKGLIRHWGVSNFDVPDLVKLIGVPGGSAIETDQLLYNLQRRGIEWDLLPRCRQASLPVLAYSPYLRGRMLDHPALTRVAERHGASTAQVGLAWVLRQDGVCVIPKSANPEHVRDNRGAAELILTAEDLADLDRAFPPPAGPEPLSVL